MDRIKIKKTEKEQPGERQSLLSQMANKITKYNSRTYSRDTKEKKDRSKAWNNLESKMPRPNFTPVPKGPDYAQRGEVWDYTDHLEDSGLIPNKTPTKKAASVFQASNFPPASKSTFSDDINYALNRDAIESLKKPSTTDFIANHEALNLLDSRLTEEGEKLSEEEKLFLAIENAQERVAIVLLERNNLDPLITNSNGDTFLHLASYHNLYLVAKKLINQENLINIENKNQETPLHNACLHCPGLVQILIEAGANVHLKDIDGNTPLHKACFNENIPILRQLLHQGANINAINHAGETALSLTCSLGLEQTASFLLKQGADFTIPDMDGKLPYDKASEFEHFPENIINKMKIK
jgi:ankyrin repeat protein